jgi:hypothetical protein
VKTSGDTAWTTDWTPVRQRGRRGCLWREGGEIRRLFRKPDG